MARGLTIWVTEVIHDDALAFLRTRATVLGPGDLPDDQRQAVEAVIVRGRRVDEHFLETLPKLKVIGKHGAGLDNIDQAEAAKRGIIVMRAEGANAESVADLAIGLSLTLLRQTDVHDDVLHARLSPKHKPGAGYELSERKAGIIGVGAVGSRVAKRLIHGFGVHTAGYDPYLAQANWPTGLVRCGSLADLLKQTDLLFLHVPLTDETRHMIDSKTLSWMPKGGFLVNCARGGIVDETALLGALTSGQLCGAATDVFADEPVSLEHALLTAPVRLIATPHIGAATEAALKRTGLNIAQKVVDHLT